VANNKMTAPRVLGSAGTCLQACVNYKNVVYFLMGYSPASEDAGE